MGVSVASEERTTRRGRPAVVAVTTAMVLAIIGGAWLIGHRTGSSDARQPLPVAPTTGRVVLVVTSGQPWSAEQQADYVQATTARQIRSDAAMDAASRACLAILAGASSEAAVERVKVTGLSTEQANQVVSLAGRYLCP